MKCLAPLTLTLTLLVSGLGLNPTLAAEWSYSGLTGPEHWADLSPANAACATGKQQSPINITLSKSRPARMPMLDFQYQSGSAELVNNGHTVQVNVAAGNRLNVGDEPAELLQFHFHAPSEERFDGKQYPLSAHLVHKTAAGRLLVVAVEFKEGAHNAALQPLLAALPAAGKQQNLKDFNPALLMPSDSSYFRFTGSLTTPPCSENVSWQVVRQAVELSKAQIDAFRRLYPMNARPVQPLNGRLVEVSE